MNQQLMTQGGRLDAVFFCPHTPEDECDCRKPKPGMLLDIGRRYGADLSQVPMVGDTLRDLLAAQAAGCEPHLVLCGRAKGLAADQVHQMLHQVPAAQVHADLSAFADHILTREHKPDSVLGGLN
jgi:D-glycero-D-manno-heptose 1,7-bisphosphate phosphatase